MGESGKTHEIRATIVRVKYKGTYDRRFMFAAFFLPPSQVPDAFSQGEDAEKNFWRTHDSNLFSVGTGTTCGAAMRDLYKKERLRTDNLPSGNKFETVKGKGEYE